MPRKLFAALLPITALVLAACSSTTNPPAEVVAAEPTRPAPTGPVACARPIADFERLIDDDVKTGHLNADVHRRINADLTGVRVSCAANRVGPALADLAAVKSRYGYR
jgi:hypothetical protein